MKWGVLDQAPISKGDTPEQQRNSVTFDISTFLSGFCSKKLAEGQPHGKGSGSRSGGQTVDIFHNGS
ncbi:hypothetical protein ACTWP4_22200 [Gracilibacillus sp. D59]|uniref:hypothetical protein n=1 Tax=Gracilibacillus sp. D59 TaxID=3457434 RepID=UPI003FCCC6FA